MNVAEFLAKSARTYADCEAIRFGSEALTYAQLHSEVGRVAGALTAAGVARGDRVVVWMPNRMELPIGLLAAFHGGFVAVPVNARLHPAEVTYILSNSGARALLYDASLATVAEGWAGSLDPNLLVFEAATLPRAEAPIGCASMEPDESAWLFYTSGTTGFPKGADLTHGNLVAAAMNCLADICSFQPEDVVLHAAPLTHGSGMYLMPALARGSRNLVLTGSFDPGRLFALVRLERVSVIAFVAPTQIVALIDHPDAAVADMSSLRAVVYGGGPMYVRHIRRALDLWGPIFVQLYGQGESPMTGTYLRQLDHLGSGEDQARRLGSIGIARTDVELRVFDADEQPLPPGEVGELVIRSATVMRGYWANPTATAEALRGGWLHTGDVGFCDSDGYIHLVDRAKDMIVSGGNNVYAREVEEALLAHPAVKEVAVIGIPDDYWGEAVHAIVVFLVPVTAEELIVHCRERLAAYKRPRSIALVESLPKNAYGKVLKRELRKEHWGDQGRLIAGGEAATTTQEK